ncbi:MAG TPA: hypothetical protein PLD76_00510 [Paludibacteraceae bacterium]|nr:hypothetical protein [Paludibacteraceae bacterium]
MLVSAKWQIAYKNVYHRAGDVFEMADGDYGQYKNDIVIVNDGVWKKPVVKQETSVDTYQNREKFEEETGKKAFWNGVLTKSYLSWLENK